MGVGVCGNEVVSLGPLSRPSPTRGEGTEVRLAFEVMPVCAPMPARPWAMPGLRSSASDGSSAGVSGRAALARVGFAGSFFECFAGLRACGARGRSGPFAIATIWVESHGEESAALCARHSGLPRMRQVRNPYSLTGESFRAPRFARPRMKVYSSRIPARLMTSPHLLASAAINAANSSGVPPAGSSPTFR